MELLQLGPFALNRQLLALVLAMAAGYAAVRLAFRRSPRRQTPLSDVILNGLIIGFLVWKALPAVRDPSLLWPNPLKALMVPGGFAEAAIGAAAGLAYAVIASLVRGIPLRALADAAGIGLAAFLPVRGLAGGWKYGVPTDLPWGVSLADPALRYHPLNAYEALLGLALLAAAMAARTRTGDGRTGARLLPLLGAGLVAISLFARTDAVWLLLTPAQWFGASLFAVGLFLPRLYILWEATQERRGWRMPQGDSKEQRKQAKQNARNASPPPEQPGFNKKTDGPNRPAE